MITITIHIFLQTGKYTVLERRNLHMVWIQLQKKKRKLNIVKKTEIYSKNVNVLKKNGNILKHCIDIYLFSKITILRKQ